MQLNIPPFKPLPWASGPHAQTILGDLWSHQKLLSTDERHEIAIRDGDRLVLFVRQTITPSSKPIVYLFHGLGGSAESGYVPHMAGIFSQAGYIVVMVNQRGCGSGAGLAALPYNAGRVEDMSQVFSWGRKMFPGHGHIAIAFSLMGNMLLLLSGKYPQLVLPDVAIAVSAPLDLQDTSRRLSTLSNRLYDLNFVHETRRHIAYQRKAGLLKAEIKIPPFATMKQVDDIYTVPLSGFRDSDDYYQQCSSLPHLSKIRVPTVMLCAADDPFVGNDTYNRANLSSSINLHIERHGGHIGFIADQSTILGSRRWLDLALLRHVENNSSS